MLMSLNDKSSRNFLTRNKVETRQFKVSHRLRCQIHCQDPVFVVWGLRKFRKFKL